MSDTMQGQQRVYRQQDEDTLWRAYWQEEERMRREAYDQAWAAMGK